MLLKTSKAALALGIALALGGCALPLDSIWPFAAEPPLDRPMAPAPSAKPISPPPAKPIANAPTPAPAPERKPLVVIRFDRPDIAYEQGLYEAMAKALERRPQAAFDLVAVSTPSNDIGQFSANQDQSRRNTERVMKTLTEMGLPAERIALSSTTGPDLAANEIRIYLR